MNFSKELYRRFNDIKVSKNNYDNENEKIENDNKDCLNITEDDIRIEIDNNIDMKYNDTLYDLSIDLENYCKDNAHPLNIDFVKFKNMIMDNSSALETEYENLKEQMNNELFLEYNEMQQLERDIEMQNSF